MNEKETKTVDTSFSTPLQIHNTLDSQWRRSGTYCNFLDNFCGDSQLKSAHDQTSNHKVVWTVGDRLRLHHVPLINGTKTNDNPHAQVNGRESNFADVESRLENSAVGSGKERKEKAGNENQEAERTFAFAKLQDVRMTASVALREALDARDQTLQARKEALAARREAIEAQKEAMRARNEALMIRTEMSEARRTLTEVTKAITTMLEEVQQIHAEALGKILDQRAHKELQKKCVRDNEIDTLVATENGIYATKKVLFDKVKQEEDKKDLLNSLSLVKSSRSKSPLVVEPHIIVTNSQTMKTKHACHTVPDTLSEDIYSKNLPKTCESSPNKRSPENLNIRLSKVRESEIDVASGACVDNDINVSCKDTDLVEHMKLPETGVMLSDVKQNIGDPSKNCKKDSSIRRHIEENDSISKESDDSDDDLTNAEEGDLKKTAPEMPNAGSFVQKWGDFIGRISTLMITIVTAVNTGEALVDSLLAGSFIKAGTFAFLLLCIHLPVAAVMIWLLLKEKVQQIKDIIGKVKAVLPFLFRVAKRSVRKAQNHSSLVNEEVGETSATNEELEPRDNSGSIFVVGSQRSRGVINEAFTDTTQSDRCNPIST